MEVAFYLGQGRLSDKVMFDQRGKGKEGVKWIPRARVFQTNAETKAACAHRAGSREGHCDCPGEVARDKELKKRSEIGGGNGYVGSCILYLVRWEIN